MLFVIFQHQGTPCEHRKWPVLRELVNPLRIRWIAYGPGLKNWGIKTPMGPVFADQQIDQVINLELCVVRVFSLNSLKIKGAHWMQLLTCLRVWSTTKDWLAGLFIMFWWIIFITLWLFSCNCCCPSLCLIKQRLMGRVG